MKVNFSATAWSLVLFGTLFLCSSCKKDPDPAPTPGRYEKGIFVVNEGPYGGTGTITWHDPATGETVQDIYGKANGGATLGAYAQSLTFHNGKGYIVVNGANRVVVVEAATFKFLDTIGGLILPRFFQPLDDRYAYVSQWGAGGLQGSIAKVDLLTNRVVKTISTGAGPEKMLLADGALWVANSGGFGVDSTVAHIFTGTEDVVLIETIPGQRNPACLARAAGVSAYPFAVLCKGDYQDAASTGWLTRADAPNTTGLTAVPGADDLVAAPDGSTYYFTGGTAIYACDQSGLKKLFDQPAYGLTCDQVTGELYCADAKGFLVNGEVVIRKPDGSQVGSFAAGIGPGEVVIVR